MEGAPKQNGSRDCIEKAVLQKSQNRLILYCAQNVLLSDAESADLIDQYAKLFPKLHVVLEKTGESAPQPLAPQEKPVPSEAGMVFAKSEKPVQKKDPAILYGNKIREKKGTPIHELFDGMGLTVISGHILSGEMKEGWAGRNSGAQGQKHVSYRIQFTFTDDTDSIYCVFSFPEENRAQRFYDLISPYFGTDQEFLIKGVCKMPKFSKEILFYPNDINLTDKEKRTDTSPEKRVELHLHTRMSTMDGLTDLTKAFMTAKAFGHKALAVTDHGVVQAFPEAAKAAKKSGVKAIYGVEGYLLPDCAFVPVSSDHVVFDIETTGLKYKSCDIIEIGAVKVRGGQIVDRFQTFVNDGAVIPPNISALTHITNEMIAGAPSSKEVLRSFREFCEGCYLVAHNAKFDTSFIKYHGMKHGIDFPMPVADSLMLSRYLLHDLPNHKLDTVCGHFGIDLSHHHRASDDAEATSEIFDRFCGMIRELGSDRIPVYEKLAEEEDEKSAGHTNHIIILAKTQAGMKNLYRLVSYAHLDFFKKRPRIPKSLLSIYRNGLILGSACEQGELYRAILAGKDGEELKRIASFYDYLEIQPDGNNEFMVRDRIVDSVEDLHEINRQIVSLGKELDRPVAATGDVHFLNPEDAVYRKLILCKQGFKDAEFQAPLYFKTTDEMLRDFSYLGEEEAHSAVIDVPNRIADMCDVLKPFPDGTHAPEIPNASEILRDMTMKRAHEIYGDPLPDLIQKRLDKELTSIIGNGFASLYLMAQRLVHKSESDGYLVGSRGSVGSSFVATMAGITEVNPLPAHYVCPKCRYTEFNSTPMDSACGLDMPDKACPNCGTPLRKQGFDIPFEVFLGFHGDKTPDIDLNFSGEYQPVAHKYVEEMFGKGHAFRAGTISGLAERKAFECIFHYQDETGTVFRNAEIERLCKGCLNVKVTTGQHPGGIVIVPKEDDILDYTPVQYPADKQDKNTITTHFDFHAMDDRLVKLDILGHDDPTAIRMLQDVTGINPRTIPLDDPETRSLFSSPEALGVDLSKIGCTVGSLGVPEFGTEFVRGVLESTKPTTMEEFVRISGLTHGTDVWLNNAEPLVTNHIAKLSEVLCTRDDIMNYLIAHGMDASVSFSIMEKVRKGRGLSEEHEKALIDGSIPDWFIDSCKKIKYMFPRGHAVAYVTMAFRIAYFKVHYPLAFYAVYFSVRADIFDVTKSLGGPDKVLAVIKELSRDSQNKEAAEKKRDRELQTILELVYEMNLRGIELLPVDIYKSDATKFLIEGHALRPPFNSIPGIGDTAAISIVKNRGDTPFVSVEDFQNRTGANTGVVSMLDECGCFMNLPKTNQISLF